MQKLHEIRRIKNELTPDVLFLSEVGEKYINKNHLMLPSYEEFRVSTKVGNSVQIRMLCMVYAKEHKIIIVETHGVRTGDMRLPH